MRILFAAAEVAPLTKVGGLADVVRSLPDELARRGHDVRVIVPKYGFVDYSPYRITDAVSNLAVLSLGECRKVSVEQIDLDGLPVYLVECDIFKKAGSVYGVHEVERFWVFCDCISEALYRLGWQPEIVHCHDWHTALVPMMARKNHAGYRTVFTIHNIRYQGNIDDQIMMRSGIAHYWSCSVHGMPYLPWNMLSQGILWADAVNAVSENYAREILTYEGGNGMSDLLRFRKDSLSGIMNGLGDDEYNPADDKLIPASFSPSDLSGKEINRREIQVKAGWKEDGDIPIVGMVARLDEQKGMDIILEAVPAVLGDTDMRFVFQGLGSKDYERALRGLESRYPGNVKAFITYDNAVAHLVYAGSDLFLMPSKWEPCGLGQMIAMRYGTVPIVRRTGGLADTVSSLSPDMKRGTGIIFNEYASGELVAALKKAVEMYRNRAAWKRVVERIMKQDFSWRVPAEKYESLYQKVLGQYND